MNIKLTKGYYRFVLLIGGFAIKIPRSIDALECNKREKYLWNNSTPETKEKLCPVITACRFLVVMKRCQAFANFDQIENAEQFVMITTDDKNWNFGRLNGKTVCLDYGSH